MSAPEDPVLRKLLHPEEKWDLYAGDFPDDPLVRVLIVLQGEGCEIEEPEIAALEAYRADRALIVEFGKAQADPKRYEAARNALLARARELVSK